MNQNWLGWGTAEFLCFQHFFLLICSKKNPRVWFCLKCVLKVFNRKNTNATIPSRTNVTHLLQVWVTNMHSFTGKKSTGFVCRISWKTVIFQKVSLKYYKYVKGTTLAFLLKVFLSNCSHEMLIYCQVFCGKSTQSCFSWQWEVSLSQSKICFSIISCFLNIFHIYLCLPLFLLHGNAALTQLVEFAWLHTGAAIEFQNENLSSLFFSVLFATQTHNCIWSVFK